MAKRTKYLEPVTVQEVHDLVLRMITEGFGDRPVTEDVIRLGSHRSRTA